MWLSLSLSLSCLALSPLCFFISLAANILREFRVLTITNEVTDAISKAVNNSDAKACEDCLCNSAILVFQCFQQKNNLCLLVLPSTFVYVRHCLPPRAVLHAQKPSLPSSDLFTSFMLIHSFCRNASVWGQTQGKEQGFSLVILSLPWTPHCRFHFFLIPRSLHPATPPPSSYLCWIIKSPWNPLQEVKARVCQLLQIYVEGPSGSECQE